MFYEGLYRHPKSLNLRLKRENEEHHALVNAISKKDVDLAEQISIRHIRGMKEDLLEVFEISSHILEQKQQQMGLLRISMEL
jgi:DNA-binding GntR family transcriptional regulator